MLRLNGIVKFVGKPKKFGDKQVVTLMVEQSEEGQRPNFYNFDVWNNDDCFADVLVLGQGEEIEIKTNIGCEKKKGVLTGNVKYYLQEVSTL